MRRAVAYIRSSETTDERMQRSAIEGWATRERIDVRSWEIDAGVDGATPIAERPGLMAAYRAIRENEADTLVAANAERFSRDELVCWLIERAALVEGAAIATADGSRLPSPANGEDAGAAYTRGAVDLARAYHQVTVRARIRAALAEKRARGERVGNLRFGYRIGSDGIHVEPDEKEQGIIESVRALSGEGLSQRAIARQLEARGIVGRTGAPLRQTQISTILRSAG